MGIVGILLQGGVVDGLSDCPGLGGCGLAISSRSNRKHRRIYSSLPSKLQRHQHGRPFRDHVERIDRTAPVFRLLTIL